MEQQQFDDNDKKPAVDNGQAGFRVRPMLAGLREFVEAHRQYAEETLVPLRNTLTELLSAWRQPAHWHKLIDGEEEPVPSPVQRVRVRIKQAGAVVRKVMAKPDRFPDGFSSESFRSMTDAVGARVVVYFLSSLPLIDQEIRQCGWFEVSTERPPHAYMTETTRASLGIDIECRTKPSGYNSIHYILRLREEVQPVGERPWFELQLRTLTQDVWAEIEHLLGYKYRTSSPKVQAQLRLIGQLLETIDEYFDYMVGELSNSRSRDTLDESSPLTVLNLPRVLASHGLSCSQYDVEGVLKMATSCGLKTVRDISGVLTQENIDRVSDAARAVLNRVPIGSELVPALLLFGRIPNAERDEMLARWAEFVQMFEVNT